VTWSRRFLLIKPIGNEASQEYPGLGPCGTRTGDAVCVLYGCSVPVILGPKKNHHGVIETDKNGDPKYYELIGECFAYGMMEGQAVRGVKSGKYKRSEFNIK
jgi:hypothetical protein